MLRRAEKRCFRCGVILLCSIFCLLALYSPVYQPSTQREVMVQGWEANISRNTRQYVLPENVTTAINVNNLCPSDLFLLVIVCSAPANFEQRSAIRDTWASLAEDSARVAFLLGESDNSTLQAKVVEESGIYDDIIQEGFVDSYNNLTIKSVMMLKWVQQHCSSARFLMKSDDDIYLNLPALSEALQPVAKRKNILIGSLICKAKPIQDSTNKWYTPQYIFNEPYFPNYLSGTGYVMSQDVVSKLYKAALSTPIIHLEDVYITGVCSRAAGVKPLNHYGFFYQRRKLSDSCNPKVFTNHRMSPDDLRTAFSHVSNCSTPTSTPFLVTTPTSHYRAKRLPVSTTCH
ncbi:beta-1,3-galactosyltransferase 1-like [Macrosteles quadrilineatus]|uniref:beta-1,3-galactosyltransferase 1-like n=1 Tax=Macrosteles quadrilineatus TaxID=74068 RepID=UPI0023E2987A|nr:beta-1,3-galactosyltransferase 1-like [Macrosteles quadrilineatus]XP_054280333.1 beta-1,3-galactosyltransferase 1-like [Macrosteles quadrilineatus]